MPVMRKKTYQELCKLARYLEEFPNARGEQIASHFGKSVDWANKARKKVYKLGLAKGPGPSVGRPRHRF